MSFFHARMARLVSIGLMTTLAVGSLAWGGWHALTDSADLMKRSEEVALFVRGDDPYRDPDSTYPPPAFPILMPIVAPFGPAALRSFWLVLNLGAAAYAATLLARVYGCRWPNWLRLLVLFAVLASKPVRLGIGLGQFHLIPLALVLTAMLALRARREIVAGVLIGLALAKPTMVVPYFGVLLAQRRWRAICAAVVVQGVAFAATVSWLGIGPRRLIREWLELARGQQAAGLVDVPSLLGRLGLPATSLGTSLGLVLLGLAIAVCLRYRRATDTALAAFAMMVAAVFTYHRPYDLVLLLPAFALSVDRAWRGKAHGLIAVAIGGILIAPLDPIPAGPIREAAEWLVVAAAYWLLILSVIELRESAAGSVSADPVHL